MKIATYNIQNIFRRDKRLLQNHLLESMKTWMKEFEILRLKARRTEAEYETMRELAPLLDFDNRLSISYLEKQKQIGDFYIEESKRITEKKDSLSNTQNTTRGIHQSVIRNKTKAILEVNPDVLFLQEVENRASLLAFNKQYLDNEYTQGYCIETNDKQSRHLGVLLKDGYTVLSIKSHSSDLDHRGKYLFNFDLQEYEIAAPSGNIVWVLNTHLREQLKPEKKSKFIRKLQVEKIIEVYNDHIKKGHQNIIILGSFNVPSYDSSIVPLIDHKDLKQITKHLTFSATLDKGKDGSYGSMQGYKMGVNLKQQDYILLSSNLFKNIKESGLNRNYIFPKTALQWTTSKSLKSHCQMASNHPILFFKIG